MQTLKIKKSSQRSPDTASRVTSISPGPGPPHACAWALAPGWPGRTLQLTQRRCPPGTRHSGNTRPSHMPLTASSCPQATSWSRSGAPPKPGCPGPLSAFFTEQGLQSRGTPRVRRAGRWLSVAGSRAAPACAADSSCHGFSEPRAEADVSVPLVPTAAPAQGGSGRSRAWPDLIEAESRTPHANGPPPEDQLSRPLPRGPRWSRRGCCACAGALVTDR